MPRTKRPVKKAKNSIDGGGGESKAELLKKFDRFVAEQKKKIEALAQFEVRSLETQFQILLGSISKSHLTMTVGQLKNELYFKEVSNCKSMLTTSDEGYLTENSSQGSGGMPVQKPMGPPPSASRSVRRSRSADASSRKLTAPPARPVTRRRSRSVYRTPAQYKLAGPEYPPITPKVKPQTPLTLLRQPRHGEMVVSMQGSPVMVPNFNTMQPDEAASCNIVLSDGTTLSLRPRELRQSSAYIPVTLMGPSVWQQIRTLKDNLDTIMGLVLLE